jgi:hypothetical protein
MFAPRGAGFIMEIDVTEWFRVERFLRDRLELLQRHGFTIEVRKLRIIPNSS